MAHFDQYGRTETQFTLGEYRITVRTFKDGRHMIFVYWKNMAPWHHIRIDEDSGKLLLHAISFGEDKYVASGLSSDDDISHYVRKAISRLEEREPIPANDSDEYCPTFSQDMV